MSTMEKVEWLCPKCGAPPNEHGRGGLDDCKQQYEASSGSCMGFLCECDDEDTAGHGDTPDKPCPNAVCYHCGWHGTFPPMPFKLTGWMKKAWDEGWRPPPGWQPK